MSVSVAPAISTSASFQKPTSSVETKKVKLQIHLKKNGKSYANCQVVTTPAPEVPKEPEQSKPVRKEPSIRKRKLCTEKAAPVKRSRRDEEPENVSPKFFSPLDREFSDLMKEFSVNEEWADDQAKFQKNLVKYSGITLTKTYLSDFWRHELEKHRGRKKMWDEITGFSEGWWRDEHEEPLCRNVKTRWQEVAENFFHELLAFNEPFTAENPYHLKLLADLSQRAQKEGDTALQQIIWNYTRTLE